MIADNRLSTLPPINAIARADWTSGAPVPRIAMSFFELALRCRESETVAL